MKTPPELFPAGPATNTRARVVLLFLLLICLRSPAQVQWYQSQDGNNSWPNGTIATSIRPLTATSFIACYQWSINNDQFTWKISKTNMAGEELSAFYVTGTTSLVEVKAGKNAVYVYERSFPPGRAPQYVIYKLDQNLNLTCRKEIVLPGDFNIFNMSAFELDRLDNIYLAGDGMYFDGATYLPASFVIKSDKALALKWTYMDSSQATYSRLHVNDSGYVIVINDSYTFFPEMRLRIIHPTGLQTAEKVINGDPSRYSMFSMLDANNNLFIYGSKGVTDITQAVYLQKISGATGAVVFSKTLFESLGTQLMDLKLDKAGNIYSLVQQYFSVEGPVNKVSRINPITGNTDWSKCYYFNEDSCNLSRLVMNESDRFYAIGEKRWNSWYSQGFMARLRKGGSKDGNFISPDSASYLRSHWLSDGIMDHDNRVIAIGGTMDLDTITFMNTYLRAFAIRYSNNQGSERSSFVSDEVDNSSSAKINVYPNPVQDELIVSDLKEGDYDRLIIYNMQGVQVFQQPVGSTSVRVNISKLENGAYLVVLRSSVRKSGKSTMIVVKR
jgi:hypothetical protein